MNRQLGFFCLLGSLTLGGLAALGQYAPPPTVPQEDAVLKQIEARTDQLRQMILRLRAAGVKDPFLADVEIYYKAGVYMLHHGEFYNKDAGKWTLEILDRGMLRATQQ